MCSGCHEVKKFLPSFILSLMYYYNYTEIEYTLNSIIIILFSISLEGRKEMFYLTTRSLNTFTPVSLCDYLINFKDYYTIIIMVFIYTKISHIIIIVIYIYIYIYIYFFFFKLLLFFKKCSLKYVVCCNRF